jgi:vancomycin aglycone glucosyltransferase
VRVLLARGWAGLALDPGIRARAKAVAATIRVDGATVAADLLVSSAAG